MSIITKLYIEESYLNILSFRFSFNQNASTNGFPSSKPTGGLWELTFETAKNDLFLEKMMTKEMITYLKIIITPRSLDTRSRVIELRDVHVLEHKNNFNGVNSDPMKTYVKLSPATMVQNGVPLMEKYWKVTDINTKVTETTTSKAPTPNVISLDWIHPETKESIEETTYSEKVALIAQIENAESDTTMISIAKEDGTEFENGEKELLFEEAINEDGIVELTALEIKEKWQDFKVASIDKLIAKVDHNGYQKRSSALQINPKPNVTVHFRPHANWSGEYGFDWMRIKDTAIDGDTDYKKNVGSYGEIYASNGGTFTAKNYDKLEKEYGPLNINEKKDENGKPIEYYTPWLNLYRDASPKKTPYANLELVIDVEAAANEVYIEFNKTYFNITNAVDSPDDSKYKRFYLEKENIQLQTATMPPNKINIKLECINDFSKDQTIKVWTLQHSYIMQKPTRILSGQLKVMANNKANRRVSKIVFVNVITDINWNNIGVQGISPSSSANQEKYLTPFLKQALIKPKIANVNLDLSNNAHTSVQNLQHYHTTRTKGKYVFNGSKGLINYLQKMFDTVPSNSKYKSYFKVFFVGEKGVFKDSSGKIHALGGSANGINSKECIMYSDPQEFYVAHELMHCMGLYHSFDNSGLHTFKIGQTENIMDYSHLKQFAGPKTLTQMSTWKWQWKILKKSNSKER